MRVSSKLSENYHNSLEYAHVLCVIMTSIKRVHYQHGIEFCQKAIRLMRFLGFK